MRIAYLSTDSGITLGGAKGASIHVAEIVEALAAEGAEVRLAVAGVAPAARLPRGVTVDELPRTSIDGWLRRWLAEFRPAALYERLALHTDAGARAARAARIPHLVELNAPLLEEAARYRRLDQPTAADELERATLQSAAIVLAVSPPLAEYAYTRGARRVEVAQNAAAVDRFSVSTQRHDGRAVFVGSLRAWHGLEAIATAWRTLGAAAPPLRVIGDGPAREVLADVPGVEMMGAVAASAVPALLADADIALAPYGQQTPRYFSPIKLFEYLAAGLATIVGDLPAVTSLVDYESAVVIGAGDADALADAVAWLSTDIGARQRLGTNGRALVEVEHTWRRRAHRIIELVGELERREVAA